MEANVLTGIVPSIHPIQRSIYGVKLPSYLRKTLVKLGNENKVLHQGPPWSWIFLLLARMKFFRRVTHQAIAELSHGYS